MKTLFLLAIGFTAGLYFSDYRSVQFVKRETKQAIAQIDRALR